MSCCMLPSCFETDLLSRNTQPLPLPHPPNHLPAPPLRRAPGTACDGMNAQGRIRQQRASTTGGYQAHPANGSA